MGARASKTEAKLNAAEAAAAEATRTGAPLSYSLCYTRGGGWDFPEDPLYSLRPFAGKRAVRLHARDTALAKWRSEAAAVARARLPPSPWIADRVAWHSSLRFFLPMFRNLFP